MGAVFLALLALTQAGHPDISHRPTPRDRHEACFHRRVDKEIPMHKYFFAFLICVPAWTTAQPASRLSEQARAFVSEGDPVARAADLRNVVIVFKDGVGYDSKKLIDAVDGLVGLK